jgi:hypothetical protein
MGAGSTAELTVLLMKAFDRVDQRTQAVFALLTGFADFRFDRAA